MSNGAETGIRWKRGEEPRLRVLRLGAEKTAGGWGRGDSKEMGREAQGPEDEATGCHLGQSKRGGACVASTCRRAGRAAQV